MRSVIITSIGLILWALCLAAPKFFNRESPTAKSTASFAFIGIWFVVSATNLWKGVEVGYSFMEELRIFLMIFSIPTVIALVVRKKFL
jgi:hypothetical protein